ncbi:MAG: SRPBCC family protein [bacterium]
MSRLSLTARGAADPATVWLRYLEPARWSQWSPQITGVRYPIGELEAGRRGEVMGWLGLRLPFEVLAVDPMRRRWSWRVRLGPVAMLLEHEVDARTDLPGGTVTRLSVRGPLLLIAAYAPLARLALHRLVQP